MSNQPTGPGFELQEKVQSLKDALLSKHPTMPTLLQEIYKTLRAQPENVTLMTEEQIAVIVEGLKVQTQTSFAASVTKPSAAKAASAKIKQLGIAAF